MRLFHYIIFILILSSCEVTVDLEVDKPEQLVVVNGFINPNEEFLIHLSETVYINEKTLEGEKIIENATIQLFENNEALPDLEYMIRGEYKLNSFYPIAGNTYKIIVNAPEHDIDITSEITIPEPVPITSVEIATTYDFFIAEAISVKLKFKDPVDIENYYLINVREIKATYEDRTLVIYTEDPMVIKDGKYQGDVKAIFFDDTFFNGEEYEIDFMTQDFNAGIISPPYSSYIVYLNSISKDHYLFLKSRIEFLRSEKDIFAEPVFIKSNIENGAGILAAFSNSSIQYSEPGIYEIND